MRRWTKFLDVSLRVFFIYLLLAVAVLLTHALILVYQSIIRSNMANATPAYEWIFSGIGVLGVSWVGLLIYRWYKNNKGSSDPKPIEHTGVTISDSTVLGSVVGRDINIGSVVQVGAPVVEEAVYHEKPTPTEINETIRKAALYLQDSVAKSFEGIKVRWQGEIDHISVYKDGSNVSVVLECATFTVKPLVAYVMLKTTLEEYPILKTVHGGEKVEVTGIILDRSGGFIRLRNAKLKFLS